MTSRVPQGTAVLHLRQVGLDERLSLFGFEGILFPANQSTLCCESQCRTAHPVTCGYHVAPAFVVRLPLAVDNPLLLLLALGFGGLGLGGLGFGGLRFCLCHTFHLLSCPLSVFYVDCPFNSSYEFTTHKLFVNRLGQNANLECTKQAKEVTKSSAAINEKRGSCATGLVQMKARQESVGRTTAE